MPLSERISGFKTTIYLTRVSPEAEIRGKSLVFGKKPRLRRQPLASLRQVVFLGIPRCEGRLLYELLKLDIPVFFMSAMGKPMGGIIPHGCEPRPLWRAQERFDDDTRARFALAKSIVGAKVANAGRLLRSYGIDQPCLPEGLVAVPDGDWNVLRGYEGAAARRFFEGLSSLVLPFKFSGRVPRFAPDPVNAMLSLGYSLLYQRLAAALQRVGLHSGMGFYHCGRGSHQALSSDLMEDLRCLVDKYVLRLLEQKSLTPENFTMRGSQSFFRTGEAFAIFLNGFEAMAGKPFIAPVERAGLSAGRRVSLNEWLDLTAEAYAAMLCSGKQFAPFRLEASGRKSWSHETGSGVVEPAGFSGEAVTEATG